MKIKILFIVFVTGGFLVIHPLYAQWTVSQGLSGGHTYDIEVVDTMVFLAGHGIYSKSIHEDNWNRCLENYSIDEIIVTPSCLFASSGYSLLRSSDLGANWEPVNEAGEYINSVCTIDSVVFFSDIDSIFRSYDFGETWTNITGELTNLGMCKVLSQGPILYLDDVYENQQLFRSFDYGNTWLSATTEGLEGAELNCIYQEGDTIWAGTSDGVFIFDEGIPGWTAVSNGIPQNSGINDIIRFNGDLYCSTTFNGIFRRVIGNWISCNAGLEGVKAGYLAYSDSTLFSSTDRGPWQKDMSTDWFPIYEGYNHIDVNWTSIDDSVIWLCTDRGLYKSFDFGENFIKMPPDSFGYCQKMLMTYNAYYLACSKGFFISYDKGETWIKRTSGLENDNVTDIAIGPYYNYATAGGSGLYRSRTGIYEWERVPNSIGQSNVWDVVAKDSIVLAHVWSDQIYRSDDFGQNFTPISFDVNELVFIDDRFYAIFTDPVSSEDGLIWTPIVINDPDYYGWTIDVQENAVITGGTKIWGGPYDYFLSITYDEGANWTDITDNLPYSTGPWITHVNIHGTRVFAAPWDFGLYYRDDLFTGIEPAPILTPDFIKVYPNPFSEYFYVNLPDVDNEEVTISLNDLPGKIIMSKKTTNLTSIRIDMPYLKSGIYLLQATVNGQPFVKKVFKF